MEHIDTVSLTTVAGELSAHQRECAVRYGAMEKQLDSLVARIKRLENMIMLSTLSSIIAVFTIFWTVLQ